MDKKDKLAIVGAGLVVAGMGLSIVGIGLISPAVIALTARLAQKGAEGLIANLDRASRTVGTVAGNLRRSLSDVPPQPTDS